MFCPHCNNKIPDGSNICPLCYANLSGVRQQGAQHAPQEEAGRSERATHTAQPRTAAKKSAYTKGSRGKPRHNDRTPMIIAVGLIIILVIIIAMIVRSMFTAGTPQQTTPQATAPQSSAATTAPSFMVFGATATPNVAQFTPTPAIQITPTPAPVQQEVSFKTLRKGDMGKEVISLQLALIQLGFLNGAADGNFGTGTQTAVKAFQSANGLDADGIAGKDTLTALYQMSTITPIPDTTAAPGDILDLPG